MTLVTGCAIGPNAEAICVGSLEERNNLTSALLADGGDLSVQAGQALLSKIDSGCSDVKSW